MQQQRNDQSYCCCRVLSLLLPFPFRHHLRQENDVWEGGAYPRVAVPTPDSDGSGTSAVNVTLAVALSVSLVAAIVIAGVAAKFIQRKVRHENRQLPVSVCAPYQGDWVRSVVVRGSGRGGAVEISKSRADRST